MNAVEILGVVSGAATLATTGVAAYRWLVPKMLGFDLFLQLCPCGSGQPFKECHLSKLIEVGHIEFDNGVSMEASRVPSEPFVPPIYAFTAVRKSRTGPSLSRAAPVAPRAYSHLLQQMPQEFRQQFAQEMLDYVQEGLEERAATGRSRRAFIVLETWDLVLSIGKKRLLNFRHRKRRISQ